MNRASFAFAMIFVTSSLLAQTQLEPKNAPKKSPVKLSAYATENTLFVRVDLKENWHAYAPGSKAGMPVSLKFLEASDYQIAGELVVPQNEKGEVSGTAVFRVPIKRKEKKETTDAGNHLAVKFVYQVCDGRVCLPPTTCEFSGEPSKGPVNVLLMVGKKGERTDRITTMLKSQGFDCTTRTYESKPDKKFCDRFDVVVVDSESHLQSKSIRELAREFPKTQTPMVAVGCIGREVMNSHRIAMASGYM